LTVNMVWVWLSLAGVLASWLLVWAIAYNLGQEAAAGRLARFEPTAEPALNPVTPNPAPRQTNPGANSPTVPVKSPAGPVNGGSQPPAAKPAPAAPAPDTRQAGFNYLLCASLLEKSAAEGAAGFLTQNGIPATAVPSGRAGRYTVYTLLGIPSGSLDEKLKERNAHKAEVVRLGKLWRKERPGSSDFADAYWEKYRP
jgi:hypothetical protein